MDLVRIAAFRRAIQCQSRHHDKYPHDVGVGEVSTGNKAK